MIYFIGNKEHEVVKIGYTRDNVRTRHSGLQTACYFKLEVFKTLEGDRDKELALHIKFDKDRINGEWFKLSKSILDFINSAKKVSKVAPKRTYVRKDTIALYKGVNNYATINCDFCRVEVDINDTRKFYTNKNKDLIEYRIKKFIKFHPKTTVLNKEIKQGVKFYIDTTGCITNSKKEVIREVMKKYSFVIKENLYLSTKE